MSVKAEVSNLETSKAEEVILAHVRDYLTCKITIPLGNPDLKKVHTNQFLWTELPTEFVLENWEVIADSFQSKYTNYTGSASSGYTINRWYIDGIDISVDANGKAEMTLTCNAFPPDTSKWTKKYQEFTKEYTDALESVKTNNSSTKETTNASTTKSVLNQEWIKKYNIAEKVYKKAESICKTTNSTMQNVKAIFNWMDNNIGYEKYYNGQYSPTQVLSRGKGNCCDNSRLFRALCQSIGVKCNFIQNSCIGHQYNKVYIDGTGYIVDVGRWSASWGSHWGSSGCPSETESSW